MLSVLRCGFSFKFVGRDQEACWAHHGYCYEFEVSEGSTLLRERESARARETYRRRIGLTRPGMRTIVA